MKQQKRITLCLVAGVLVLAVSAAAAFGSVSGYSKAKDGVKTLLLSTDNVTIQGTGTLAVDGEATATVQVGWAMDGNNYSVHSFTQSGNQTEDTFDTMLNGVNTWYDAAQDYYHQYDYGTSGASARSNTLLGYDPDDEMSQRLVNFVEIATDTLVGDLKNNVVQIGSQDGVDLYQLSISQSQVPALVNAGLSLLAYASAEGGTYDIQYEDYDQSLIHYYETTTGTTLPDAVKGYITGDTDMGTLDLEDVYAENEALIDQVYDVCYPDDVDGEDVENWNDQYYDVLNAHDGGVVYVYADGSYDYYVDGQAFCLAHPETSMDYLEYYLGEDLSLDSVSCTFGVDQQNRLTQATFQADFTSSDSNGAHHKLTLSGEMTATDYGTTTVQPLDVGDRTQVDLGSGVESEEVTDTAVG
jgi:hypothetical protein